jgi:methionyl-tRNA synthetase
MMIKPKRYLITTPIYYVNEKPHIGHAYTTIAGDVLARFYRQQKAEVFFLTGTDEHGIRIERLAEKAGKKPKEFCDEICELFKEAWKKLDIQYDYFIRTTDERHRQAVAKFMNKLKKVDAVYKDEYKGLYCSGCENFLTEKELVDGLCPNHKEPPEKIREENYFFKLDQYLAPVQELIENDKIMIRPEGAKKEVLGLLKQGLQNFSVSREKVKWGIPLPFDQKQNIYVWTEALLNYVSAVGYGDNEAEFKKWWQDGYVIHLMAKDILKFHAVYWPAMLIAAGIKVPEFEFLHGFFTVDSRKMGKSLGNTIDPNQLV